MLSKKLFSAVLYIVLSSAASGSGSPENCTKLSDSKVRLACYDSIFGTAFVEKDEPEQPAGDKLISTENWIVRTSVSNVDDSQNVVLITEALDPNKGRFGNEVRLSFLAACRENSTNIWFHFGGHFMSDYQHGRVTYRIDKQEAKRKSFIESNNHESLGLWSGGSAIPFLKQLMGHDRLYIKATPHSESALEAVFDISGLEEAIKPLREACNW